MSSGREYSRTERDACPQCGKLKMADAKLCRDCRNSERLTRSAKRRKVCPHCGKQINMRASMCLPCHNARQGKGIIEATPIPPVRIMLTAGHSIFDEPPASRNRGPRGSYKKREP